MKDNFKTKVDYLNSTNKVNWILALFALISAIPGGIRLVRFIMDSFDNIIEPSNLLGVGDFMLPGIDTGFREPYVTLGILVLSVLIPIIIFLFLLLKNQDLKDGKTGTGLYWFIVILGIIGVLLGIGIIGNLYPQDPTVASNLQAGPENLFIAGISALSAITALAGIIFIGKAAKAPLADEEEEEDEFQLMVFDRQEQTTPSTTETPATSPQATTSEQEPSESPKILPSKTKTALQEEENAPSKELVASKDSTLAKLKNESKLEAKPDLSKTAIPVQPTVALEAKEQVDAPGPTGVSKPKIAASVQPVSQTNSMSETKPTETPTLDIEKDRVLKRKLIAYPGDDTKVILIVREYLHGKFVREWSEIRLKSDFVKKTKRPLA